MFSFLKRTLMIVIGFLLIAVFIWYAGPLFGFGPYHPLESETARLIAIAVVVGLWFLSRLIRKLRAFRMSDQLLAAVIAKPNTEPGRPSPEASKLRERFEEAVTTLKQQRRSGHSLYDLPWYVIIGAPGSGKTTALLNSGLTFPLEQRVGKGALRGVGGTRNCDWWFTDEAVFLDTAGRYTTQDSDAASDSAGWAEFLSLLRKYRARRPVNGVILTLNAHDLMVQSAAAREGHVEAAQRRLTELNRELGIQLPVYLLVTKCDLVAGFTEYFDDLSVDGRRQVWGVTFPYEQTLNNEAARLFPEEFDALMGRLNERVFSRVEDVRDVRRRTRIFAFPQQMAVLRDALAEFVGEVFAATRFDQQVLLRGVYFTSGTQDGTPIDRLLAGIGRRFGVAPEAMAPASGQGKAYFVERLLKDVMIGESGLAGLNRRLEARKAAAQLGAYAAVAAVAVLGVLLWSISYARNRAFLDQVAVEVAAMKKLPLAPPAAPLDALRPRLDALRALVDSADSYRAATSWTMRWGLYQGRTIGDAIRSAYTRELDGTLLPRVAAQMRNRLVEYARSPEDLYVYLKAYLMFGDPQRLDKELLRQMADLEWANPSVAAPETGRAMSAHFQSLLDFEDTLRPLPLDQKLIAQVRSSIRQASVAQMFYGATKRQYADDKRGINLAAVSGVNTEHVFKRRSGRGLSEPVPALYTRPVFEEMTGTRQAELGKRLLEDRWVWGEGNAALSDPLRIAREVIALYEQDYIRAWDETLGDIEVVSFPTVQQTAQALRTLAAATSPLRGLLDTVRQNTRLVEGAKPAAPGVLDKARQTVESVTAAAKKVIGGTGGAPGATVTAYFQPIHELVTGEPGKQPIDEILAVIRDIETQLNTVGPDVAAVESAKILQDPKLRGLVQSLQLQADTLPPRAAALVSGVKTMVEDIVITDATRQIKASYEQQVLSDCRLVASRYPFAAGASDIPVADFARVFGNDGTFHKFFTQHLAKQVDASRRPWTMLPGAATLSRPLLDLFAHAEMIREMFFAAGGQGPVLNFWVTIGKLDPSATRFVLEFNGQLADGAAGPARRKSLQWPGEGPGAAVGKFEEQFIPQLAISEPGPWALFRIIDRFATAPPDSLGRLTFEIKNLYHSVEVVLEPPSARTSPFGRDWREFTCTVS